MNLRPLPYQGSALTELSYRPAGSGRASTRAAGEPTGAQGPNAQVGLVYATFWIEKVTRKSGAHFMQLQYAQMAVLNFRVYKLLHPSEEGTPARSVELGWPHISVATLRKAY